MPPYRHKAGAPDLMDADISFPLARLFDPYNMDQIPERKRMEQFEHRDLAHVKHYKAAVKIFGGPLSRKRVIVAPPMETPTKHRLGMYITRKSPPPSKTFNTDLNPQIPPEKPLPEELVIAKQAQEREDKYKAWFKERQKFRNDLENMGLNMDWLSKKPNKSVLERRVLQKLKEEEGQKIETVVISETPSPQMRVDSSDSSGLPNINVPTPLAIKILEQYLRQNKLRLIDVFTSSDKNKDWKISREEFFKICDEYKIPISQSLLEDMMVTLDMNLDEELDYREMVRGMEAWKRQRREEKRKALSRESTSVSLKSGSSLGGKKQPIDEAPVTLLEQDSRQSTPRRETQTPKQGRRRQLSIPTIDTSSRSYRPDSHDQEDIDSKPKTGSTNRSGASKLEENLDNQAKTAALTKAGLAKLEKSSNKTAMVKSDKETVQGPSGGTSDRSLSPQYLEPPGPDVRLEQLVLPTEEAMVDLRKRDREGLKGYNAKLSEIPSTIKIGSKAIDNHCMKSTMSGEAGEMVDNFRLARLQEYYDVVELCELSNVPLSRGLLEKVLLFPPDVPHSEIKKIRPPEAAPLLTSHFADPPKRPRTPIEVKHKDKVRRSKSGKLLIDTRHQYPTNLSIAPHGYKMNLSTGRAVIRRRVDCWMTFEEYEQLTKNLAIRYQHLHVKGSENAFWPGQLLDKMRLAMPPYDQPFLRDKENSMFTKVHRTKAVNYGYEPTDAWPRNDGGFTQIGIHDHFRNKTIV